MCGTSPYIRSSLQIGQLQTRMGIPQATPELTMADTGYFHGRLPYYIAKYVWEIPIHSKYLKNCATADTYGYTTRNT